MLELVLSAAVLSGGDWVSFVDATADRLVAEPEVGIDDTEEKDFAWDDLDLDGDIDLVVMRKQPFTSSGRRRNVLLMNEDGVLVDRTTEFASDSDVLNDLGFLTPTNDRDVAIADLNNDGWPDLVTAVTLSDGLSKALGHPRVYINKGEVAGVWQGFRHEDARIPQLFTTSGVPANPRFNAVCVGDVTNDGFADLYFVDGDSGGGDQSLDLNDRLLINDGNGFFVDLSGQLMTEEMLESGMGTSCAIIDMNGDGYDDVVKCTMINAPQHVSIAYNSNDSFNFFDALYVLAPVFVTVDDLDEDGRPDLLVTDDGVDRYLTNTGNDALGHAQFTSQTLAGSSGFGGNSIVRDLNADGFRDIVVTDIDIDIPGCSRQSNFYQGSDTGWNPIGPGGLDPSERTGVHDIAVFDLDGNGALDVILGRCVGTRVLLGAPIAGLEFEFPFGRPELLPPGIDQGHEINIIPTGGGALEPGTPTLHLSVDDGPFDTFPILEQMGIVHLVTFPAQECHASLRWYVSAQTTSGETIVDPPGAPISFHRSWVAATTAPIVNESFEENDAGWTTESENVMTGEWERVEPVGTSLDGLPVAPSEDATENGTFAFVTANGLPGESAGTSDVDGGPYHLISPVIDLADTDARVSFAVWFVSNDVGTSFEDLLTFSVSNDGGATWMSITELDITGTSGWERVAFVVGDWIEPTSTMRVRISTEDWPNNSITEAGVDDVMVERLLCSFTCAADVNGDFDVNFSDLLQILAAWGPCPGCDEDITSDGVVGFDDLLTLLADWGPCD